MSSVTDSITWLIWFVSLGVRESIALTAFTMVSYTSSRSGRSASECSPSSSVSVREITSETLTSCPFPILLSIYSI
jgi:hypothetical protein